MVTMAPASHEHHGTGRGRGDSCPSGCECRQLCSFLGLTSEDFWSSSSGGRGVAVRREEGREATYPYGLSGTLTHTYYIAQSWEVGIVLLHVRNYCYYLVAKSCPAFCDPVDCSPPGSSVHDISQARILEGVAISNEKTEA